RVRGMGGSERVVLALGPPCEAGKPSLLPERADTVAAAGQDLVRVRLVADIPDQAVVRRVEDIVQRNRQFDHAEAGAEMAAGLGNGIDKFGPNLRRQLRQFVLGKLAQVCRDNDLVEERRAGSWIQFMPACKFI